MPQILGAHQHRITRPCVEQSTQGNLPVVWLVLDEGIHLKQSPRIPTHCGQNSPATSRKASRSPQCVRIATLEQTSTSKRQTKQCRRMLSTGVRRKPVFFLEGATVRYESCHPWSSMAGTGIAFNFQAIFEDSILRSLSHCVHNQLR